MQIIYFCVAPSLYNANKYLRGWCFLMTKREFIKRRKLRKRKIQIFVSKVVLVAATGVAVALAVNVVGNIVTADKEEEIAVSIEGEITTLAEDSIEENTVNIYLLPESLRLLYETNEEAKEFVLGYWTNKDNIVDIELSEYENCKEVPHLLQWDKRWGYKEYSGDLFGITGCGPTCLSMAAIYLLKDTSLNPEWMRRFSERYEYSVEGNGSSWTLISDGGIRLGLSVEELALSESVMSSNLDKNSVIISVLGPGDFTSSGHFIVITDYDSEGFTVKDPNSYKNSERKWTYEELRGQIRNMWVLRKD